MFLHAFTACSGRKISMPGPDRQAEETSARLPVGKCHHDFQIRAHPLRLVSLPRALSLHTPSWFSPLSRSFFSLFCCCLRPRSHSFPVSLVFPRSVSLHPHLPLRSSLMKTPRSSLLLTMSSTSLRLPSPRLLPHRWVRPLKASITTYHYRPAADERTPRRDRPCQREASHYALSVPPLLFPSKSSHWVPDEFHYDIARWSM